MLAADWLGKEGSMADSRAYFVEHLLPTLIMALEHLLKRVAKLDMADVENLEGGKLNPVNLLGQYLMRNNPRYSNFAEVRLVLFLATTPAFTCSAVRHDGVRVVVC